MGSSKSEGGGSSGFFKPLFKKRPKTGNALCSWSWKEKRCEPASLCQYKYQASAGGACCYCCGQQTPKNKVVAYLGMLPLKNGEPALTHSIERIENSFFLEHT